MLTRTTQSTVRFDHAFTLPGSDEVMPAGSYRVYCDEDLIEGNTQSAWHRVGVYLHIPAIGVPTVSTQMVPISGDELDRALEIDRSKTV